MLHTCYSKHTVSLLSFLNIECLLSFDSNNRQVSGQRHKLNAFRKCMIWYFSQKINSLQTFSFNVRILVAPYFTALSNKQLLDSFIFPVNIKFSLFDVSGFLKKRSELKPLILRLPPIGLLLFNIFNAIAPRCPTQDQSPVVLSAVQTYENMVSPYNL